MGPYLSPWALYAQRPPAFAHSAMWPAEQNPSGIRCSPRWRTRITRTSPSGSSQWPQRSIESARPRGSSISPASQCAPLCAQGTTCSSRQNAARRAPGIACARQPSSRSMGSPHQEQLSVD